MAMAQDLDVRFDLWLKNALTNLGIDDEVMGPYIKGILESEESEEEARESLEEVLSGVIEGDFTPICKEILNNWFKHKSDKEKEDQKPKHVIDVDEKLSQLLQENKIMAPVIKHTISKEQEKLKAAILSQYSQVSDGEESCSDDGGDTQRNTNAEDVTRAEREKRDKDKEEHKQKKDKDKEDRAKQKVKEDERKEKERKRTQKGEKRR